MASVAPSHGINANVVHKWRRLAGAAPLPVASFVPVALPAPPCAALLEAHQLPLILGRSYFVCAASPSSPSTCPAARMTW